MRSIDPQASGQPVGTTPAERALTSTLDRLDRVFDEHVSAVSIPQEHRRRARERALTMSAAATEPDRAESVITLAYVADVVQAVAVDLAARPADAGRLLEHLEHATRVGRLALAREVLRAPLDIRLAPDVALEVQLSLIASCSGARTVSAWSADAAGCAQPLATVGEDNTVDDAVRACATALLQDTEPEPTHAAVGIRLDQRIEPPVAIVAGGRPPAADQRMPLLRIAAPSLEAVIEQTRGGPDRQAADEHVLSAARRRLARLRYDLHDGPQQDVHLLAADLALFREQLLPIVRGDPNYERIVGRLDDLAAELVALDGDLRRLASSLQSPFLPLGSMLDAVRELTAAFAARTGVEPETHLAGDFSVLSESQQITLLALIREALSNVREHAAATSVRVALSASPSGATAEVVDDGRGFDPESTLVQAAREGHLGLVGMHERVRMLGGETLIESRPGGPTIISVRLPAWPT